MYCKYLTRIKRVPHTYRGWEEWVDKVDDDTQERLRKGLRVKKGNTIADKATPTIRVFAVRMVRAFLHVPHPDKSQIW